MELGRKKDELFGRVKEAAGVLTNNDKLRNAGRRDQAAARVKSLSDDVKRTVDDITDRVVKGPKRSSKPSQRYDD